MKETAPQGDLILSQLRNLVSKMVLHSSESDLDCEVYPVDARAGSYVIEISKGRYTRSVIVDRRMVRHLESGNLDANLQREVRTAMLTVTRWAEDREK